MALKGQPKTPGSGRKKGTQNKRTVLDREEAREAAKKFAEAAGIKVQDIDAHTLLQLFYRCENFSPRFRKECASEALKYEKPALSSMDSRVDSQTTYVVEMPPPVADMATWWRLYGTGDKHTPDSEWESKLKLIAADAQTKKDGNDVH
jgi:hypothetical protein